MHLCPEPHCHIRPIRLTPCCQRTACAAPARQNACWAGAAHPDTSYTHAQLQTALQSDSSAAGPGEGAATLDRVTLYRLIDRLTQVGLLLCRVDANRVRRYQAMPASVHALPHFECQSCHRDQPLQGALQGNALDLEVAAQSALQALKALGYQGLSLDLAVRGVCVDCATATTSSTNGHHTASNGPPMRPA